VRLCLRAQNQIAIFWLLLAVLAVVAVTVVVVAVLAVIELRLGPLAVPVVPKVFYCSTQAFTHLLLALAALVVLVAWTRFFRL